MPILCQPNGLFTLTTANTTYQLWVDALGVLQHVYYGSRADGDLRYSIRCADRGFSGQPYDAGDERTYSLDILPQEFPCGGTGDYRATAFQLRDQTGVFGCDLRYRSHKVICGKYSLQGLPAVYADDESAQTLEILLEDAASSVQVTLRYGVLPSLDVITRAAVVRNCGVASVAVTRLYSAVLDFLGGEFDLIHFPGRYAMERAAERVPLSHTEMHIGSRRGSSGHQQNPSMILAERGADEQNGICYGAALLYSGSFSGIVQRDGYDQTRLMLGLQPEQFAYELHPGEQLMAPEAVLCCSASGLTQLSHRMHHLVRQHICRGPWRDRRRPVLINNWEATYFDFTGSKIIEIARQASDLGVEMMVLDDGWFGKRSSDQSSLGDWYVNEKKLESTLAQVSETIHSFGMKFGLWIEPEAVSENSDLYRAHPDWAFALPGRKPVRSRNQLVLDFSRPEVVDGIFGQIAAVLDRVQVEYLKMDMNRSICDVWSATAREQNSGAILYRYVLGVYDFLERLLQRYPHILIEGCSGGGARFDMGMLHYTPQIWCSDNTDAIDRLTIQQGTSYFYPACAVGSHVSAVPNHMTGRIVPFNTRAVVAMAGTFGYELDASILSDEEKAMIPQQIEAYQKDYELIRSGKYYRLHSTQDLVAWMFVSHDQREAVVSVVRIRTSANAPFPSVWLRGLLSDGYYLHCETGKQYYGSALCQAGCPLAQTLGEYEAWQAHFIQLN